MSLTSDFPPSVVAARSLALELGQGGGVAPEGVIVLTGSNFEAIANPSPSAYDDQTEYEGLSAGDQIPIGSEPQARYLTRSSSHAASVLDNQIKLPGRSYSMRPLANKGAVHDIKVNPGGPDRSPFNLYTSGWIYLTESPYSDAHSTSYVSFKYGRIWGGTTGKNHFRASFLFRNGGLDSGPQIDGTFTPNPSYHPRKFPEGQFIRIESEFIAGSYNEEDNTHSAQFRHLIDGEVVKELVATMRTEFESDEVTDTGEFRPMRLAMLGSDPNFPELVSQDFRCYMMEIHEQPNAARVELSNSPIWVDDAPMRRFYQRTLVRDNDRIEFQAYYGDLDTSLPIYAYVIKSDGAVNANGILVDGQNISAGNWENL